MVPRSVGDYQKLKKYQSRKGLKLGRKSRGLRNCPGLCNMISLRASSPITNPAISVVYPAYQQLKL